MKDVEAHISRPKDIGAFTGGFIAALMAAWKTPEQEKNWPAVEQAVQEMSKDRIGQRHAGARPDSS